MTTFDKAIVALLQARTDEADQLFKQFVTSTLNEDNSVPDDQLSGDLDAEVEDPGLTEDGVPRAKEKYIQDFDTSRRFAKIFNHHRGTRETDQQVINTVRENGQCFFIVKFRVTQRYDICFYKHEDQYYAIFKDEDSPDHFERLKFYDDEDVQTFINSF